MTKFVWISIPNRKMVIWIQMGIRGQIIYVHAVSEDGNGRTSTLFNV